jgi:hypothetical protein
VTVKFEGLRKRRSVICYKNSDVEEWLSSSKIRAEIIAFLKMEAVGLAEECEKFYTS